MPHFPFGRSASHFESVESLFETLMSSTASLAGETASPKRQPATTNAMPGRRKFSIAIPPRNPVSAPSSVKTPHALKSPDDTTYNSDGMLSNLSRRQRQRGLSTSSEGPEASASDRADIDLEGSNPKKRGAAETADYPRRRATIACEICRGRKSRCDGAKPRCRLCTELNADCVYREPGIKLDAGDKLILERLSRIEGLLQTSLVTPNDLIGQTKGISLNAHSPAMSNGTSLSRDDHMHINCDNERVYSIPIAGLGTWTNTAMGPNISTMPKTHTTPALHLLQWPMIRDLVSRPYDPQYLLRLELSREPLQLGTSYSFDLGNTGAYVQAFFERANVWYACVNPYTWQRYYRAALSKGFREGSESCLTLLVLALGAASLGGSISNVPRNQEPPGLSYFGAAWGLIPGVMTCNNTLSVQCLVLASAYLFYLVRPLEAWTLLSSTSVKLQLLLSGNNNAAVAAASIKDSGDESQQMIPSYNKELAERVYWNALLFESDLLAELDLPHSGIVQFEETVGLPCGFEDPASLHNGSVGSRDGSNDDGEDSSSTPAVPEKTTTAMTAPPPPGRDELWYFLAEIALRRLLNRVSHVIYSKDGSSSSSSNGMMGATTSLAALQPVVEELDFQLAQWYEGLPRALQFPHSKVPLSNPVQTVLRLRYFACRTIIFRPYILAVLEHEAAIIDPAVRDCCHRCLEASVRQLEHIAAHHAGHLPYLWQGALSIVSQALLVMGATLCPSLAGLLPPPDQMDAIIADVVTEVERYAHLAPSLRLSAEIVREADERRMMMLRAQGMRL